MPFNPNDLDPAIRPADDFFQYVNGKWIAANPIPADESRWGSFYTLRFDVEKQLQTLLDEIAGKDAGKAGVPASVTAHASGSDEQKVRDFYRSAIDVEKRNRLGVAPLAAMFAKVDAVADVAALARLTGELQRAGAGPFWVAFVGQDEKQSEVMALQFWQGGLSLPDRDYYLNEDEKSKKIRADYLAYITDMAARAGIVRANGANDDDADDVGAAAAFAATIMALETRLAKASLTRVELRDVEKMYNKMTVAELAALAPQVSFAEYFKALGLGERVPDTLIVGQPQFFAEVSKIFAETPLEDLKSYVRWHVLNSFASCLSEEFERRSFDFYGRTFSGATEMKPLWRRALGATNNALDELLGKLYVAKYFSEDAKRRVKELVEYLVVAYRVRIEKLDWMGAETKQKAFEKLAMFTKKLGYPDVWKDYSALTIAPDASFAENMSRAHAFEFDRKIKEVGGSVNREEWLMPPQLVNAYYMPPMNEIAFPAAILQPPFFDAAADDATNFGGIGSVIGHELTHGFDDQGSHYDAHGNIREWWTPEDRARFDAKAARLAEQFDQYEPIPGVHINGKLTLGENLADLGGLVIAYDALKLRLAETDDGARVASAPIAGTTWQQRFFIGYALTERGHDREERMRAQLQTDPHSPSEFRVNGPASNMAEFYDAFGVQKGDKLWRKPEERVEIW